MTLGDSDSEVFSCRFDPSDKYIASGFGDGAIRIYLNYYIFVYLFCLGTIDYVWEGAWER